jgi:hypothetical protein
VIRQRALLQLFIHFQACRDVRDERGFMVMNPPPRGTRSRVRQRAFRPAKQG